MSRTMIFGGGVPTAPDVKKIVDSIGIPKEGAVVKYTQLERLLHLKRDSFRFRTVLNAWKRKLFAENNVLMTAVPTVGYKAADPSERIVESKSRVRSGFKKVKMGSVVAQATDRARLSDDEKIQQTKLAMIHGQILLAQKTAPKELLAVE